MANRPKKCRCGCGEWTKGGNYRPGHDARHAAQLRENGQHALLAKRGWAGKQMPDWAKDLVEQVCSDYNRKPPRVIWRTHDLSWTSGVCEDKTEIRLRVGTFEPYAKVIVLHELAHYMSPRGHFHSKFFWTKAWELYQRYDADLLVACVAEFKYRKKAWEYCPEDIRKFYLEAAERKRTTGRWTPEQELSEPSATIVEEAPGDPELV